MYSFVFQSLVMGGDLQSWKLKENMILSGKVRKACVMLMTILLLDLCIPRSLVLSFILQIPMILINHSMLTVKYNQVMSWESIFIFKSFMNKIKLILIRIIHNGDWEPSLMFSSPYWYFWRKTCFHKNIQQFSKWYINLLLRKPCICINIWQQNKWTQQ